MNTWGGARNGAGRKQEVLRFALPIGGKVRVAVRNGDGSIEWSEDDAIVMTNDLRTMLRIRLPDGVQFELYRPAD